MISIFDSLQESEQVYFQKMSSSLSRQMWGKRKNSSVFFCYARSLHQSPLLGFSWFLSLLHNCGVISVDQAMTTGSLFSPASEKSMSGPPAPKLSSLSFGFRWVTLAIFFQRRKPHLFSNSPLLLFNKLTPPTALSCLFSVFKNSPTDCTKHCQDFAQQYSMIVIMWKAFFLVFDKEPWTLWQLENEMRGL